MKSLIKGSILMILSGILLSNAEAANNSLPDGEWSIYTSMRFTRDAVVFNNVLYTVTSGGMFLRGADGTLNTITPVEGISSTDLSAITYDPNGNLWVGMNNGILDRINPEDYTIKSITDIQDADFTRRNITVLYNKGDTIFVGTGYGISVYSIAHSEFHDSYIKFGVFPTQTPVTSIEIEGENIWVGTEAGLARGNVNDPLLAAPERWETIDSTQGLPSNLVNDIIAKNGILYVATEGGAVKFSDGIWIEVPGLHDRPVSSLDIFNNEVYAGSIRRLYRIDSGGNAIRIHPDLPSPITGLAAGIDELFILLERDGVAVDGEENWEIIVPDGPASNLFVDLAIDLNGNIWNATGNTFGSGFARFSPTDPAGNQWISYTVEGYPEIRTNNYYAVFAASDGSVWASSWGRGVTRIIPDGEVNNYYVEDGLVGGGPEGTFVVVGRAGEDSQGNLWMTSYGTDSGLPLMKWSEADGWAFSENAWNSAAHRLFEMVVDNHDTKWMISDDIQLGVFYFNENISIGTNITGWGVVTTQHGLPSPNITTLKLDKRGELWVGTNQGMAIIADVREPQISIREVFALSEQYIHSIAVDPLNRKWVGTKEGAFLISADGTQMLQHYNAENSNMRLLSDEVHAVAFESESGIVYFGTELGLSSLQTSAIAPLASMDKLTVFPNPYIIPSEHQLTIDGLTQNSSIKILTVDGRLVKSFDSPGGRVAFWDGSDKNGKTVASGVYIIIGVSEDGGEIGKSKVTLIRR